jgi:hypothetical protein
MTGKKEGGDRRDEEEGRRDEEERGRKGDMESTSTKKKTLQVTISDKTC